MPPWRESLALQVLLLAQWTWPGAASIGTRARAGFLPPQLAVQQDDVETCERGSLCNANFTLVSRHTGGFVVFNKSVGEEADDTRVEVQLAKVRELDVNGAEVDSTVHSVNFATSPVRFTLPRGGDVNLGPNNVSATKLRRQALLPNSLGEVELQVFSLTSAGKLRQDADQPWEANPSDVEWRLEFDNWHWCGSGCEADLCECGGKIGKYIEVSLSVTGSTLRKQRDAPVVIEDNRTWLGANVPLFFGELLGSPADGLGTDFEKQFPKFEADPASATGDMMLKLLIPYFPKAEQVAYRLLLRMSLVDASKISFTSLDWVKVGMVPAMALAVTLFVLHCCRPKTVYNNPLKGALNLQAGDLLLDLSDELRGDSRGESPYSQGRGAKQDSTYVEL